MIRGMIGMEFLGQACVALRSGDVEVVSDPWFSGRAHLDSWRAYPETKGPALEAMRKRIDRSTHIYISHEHADHFDPVFLRSLSRKTLVVSEFRNRRFMDALEALRDVHDLTVLAPGARLGLSPGCDLRIIPEQPRFRTNSIGVFETQYGQVINANDCGLNSATLSAVAKRGPVAVFMYTLNFMANGYPFPYLRSDDVDLASRVEAVRDQILAGYRTAVDILRPTQAIAFAGPVTFADPINAHLGAHPETMDWSMMLERLREDGVNIEWPAPGSVLQLDDDGPRFVRLEDWRQLLAKDPPAPASPSAGDGPAPSSDDVDQSAASCARRLSGLLRAAGKELGTAMYLSAVQDLDAIEGTDYAWTIEFRFDKSDASWERLAGRRPSPPHLHIVSTAPILSAFMDGSVTMDDLLLSARARFIRDPDIFDDVLHSLLRFGHDEGSGAELVNYWRKRSSTTATISVGDAGEQWTIPKFCPHEGESLERAEVCEGRLTCPRHKWVFDLATGDCLEGGDPGVNLYPKHTESA